MLVLTVAGRESLKDPAKIGHRPSLVLDRGQPQRRAHREQGHNAAPDSRLADGAPHRVRDIEGVTVTPGAYPDSLCYDHRFKDPHPQPPLPEGEGELFVMEGKLGDTPPPASGYPPGQGRPPVNPLG